MHMEKKWVRRLLISNGVVLAIVDKQPPTDAELDFLATGKLPGRTDQ